MDLLQEHFEFQQPLVQVDGRVRDVQKVSGYISIWRAFSSETELRTERRIDSISVELFSKPQAFRRSLSSKPSIIFCISENFKQRARSFPRFVLQ